MKALWVIVFVLLPLSCWALDPDAAVQPRLIVQGDAELKVAADQARFSVGVSNENADADQAMRDNSRAMQQVEKALLGAGLSKGDFSTGQFQLRPRWSSRPRNAPGGWQSEIVGYRVQNSFSVTTVQLERIGALIQAARLAGANDIGQIRFGLLNPRSYRQRTIALAVAHGRADAQAAAIAAGARLGKILQISIGAGGGPPVYPLAGVAMVKSMATEAAPPIVAPDDLLVRANVTLEYVLVPENQRGGHPQEGQ